MTCVGKELIALDLFIIIFFGDCQSIKKKVVEHRPANEFNPLNLGPKETKLA
jgi:hypothetical protein